MISRQPGVVVASRRRLACRSDSSPPGKAFARSALLTSTTSGLSSAVALIDVAAGEERNANVFGISGRNAAGEAERALIDRRRVADPRARNGEREPPPSSGTPSLTEALSTPGVFCNSSRRRSAKRAFAPRFGIIARAAGPPRRPKFARRLKPASCLLSRTKLAMRRAAPASRTTERPTWAATRLCDEDVAAARLPLMARPPSFNPSTRSARELCQAGYRPMARPVSSERPR